jgi:hypothetical protein
MNFSEGVIYMEKILITIGSVTTASRFARVMERRAGKHASVVQTPSELNTGGCSYSVKINESDIEDAKNISEQYKLPIRKIYRINGGEYDAVS